MQLFEKIFQRDDRIFLQLYFLILGVFLFLSSLTSYYLKAGIFQLPEKYTTGTILLVIIFWISTLIKLKEKRYIVGTVQFIRVELILLIQTFLIGILLTTLFKLTDNYSRAWLISTFVLSFLSLFFIKIIFDQFYNYLINSNIIQRNILLVGDALGSQNIIKKFPKKISNSVIKCLMVIDDKEQDTHFYGVPRFNLTDDINYILKHHMIGQIWIISSIKTQSYIEQLIDKFLNYSVDCRLISPESKFKFIEGLDSEAGFDFYNVSFSPFYGINLLLKNILDKILSVFFLIISVPILIISIVFIFIEDGFPVFYKQKRVGWDGKAFNMFKLRTMKQKDKKPEIKKADWLTHDVMKKSNVLTSVGRFLRRFSIDELPQFVNVLRGEMSIVGPRPHPPDSVKLSSDEILNFMQRHKCSPGLTGWAQIHGFRGTTQTNESMARRFQYDLYYIKNWSLILDFYIVMKTFFVIFFQGRDYSK